MIASLALALCVVLSGTVATYLYDRDASFGARLTTGACIGLTALGSVGFVVASFFGLTPAAILVSAAVCSLPFLLLLKPTYLEQLNRDLKEVSKRVNRFLTKPDLVSSGFVLFYIATAVVLWRVFSRGMMQDSDGISTGLLNNFGDLPFHLSVITGFAYGNNFPPEDPTYAGVRFTYPFLSDFVSAIFLRCGASLQQSLFLENIILGISFVALLHRWATVILRDRLAAFITPIIVLLNGGLGWKMLFEKAQANEKGLFGVLSDLPPSFTVVPETIWRFGNSISTLLIPQRGFLMGLPLAIIVFTQWWLATNPEAKTEVPAKKQKTKKIEEPLPTSFFATPTIVRMIGAGVVAGMIPLVHAHTYVVVMSMAGCLTLIHFRRRWREWLTFCVVGSLVALPQLVWSTSHTAVSAGSFFAWEIGWDHGKENPIWFWILNTGVFIPLIIAAVLVRGKEYLVERKVLLFYLPFTLCFIVPNFLKMAPWIWDNIKVIYYWWVASAPIVALLLSRLWKAGRFQKVFAVLLFACVTAAGALDVAGIALRSVKYEIFDAAGIQFSEVVKAQTAPRSLTLHAPVHNTPVFLTGRRSLMGYPGHIWTHGLEFAPREADIKRIYAGSPNADDLLKKYNIDYAVVGPLERHVLQVNESFFSRFEKVGDKGGYQLYKIKP